MNLYDPGFVGGRVARRGLSSLTAVLSYAGFVILILAVSLTVSKDAPATTVFPLLPVISIFAISSVGLTYTIFDRSSGMTSLIFWYFFTLFYAWPAIIQSLFGQFPWPYSPNSSDAEYCGIIVTTFLGSFLIGQRFYYLKVRMSRSKTRGTGLHREIHLKSRVTSIFLVVSIFITIFGILRVGLINFFSGRGDLSNLILDKSVAYPLFIAKGASLVGLLISIKSSDIKVRSTIFNTKLLYVFIFSITTAILYSPLSSSRFSFLGAALAVFAVLVGHPSPGAKILVTFFMFIFNFFALGKVKGLSNLQLPGIQDLLGDFPGNLFRVDFDPYQISVATITYVGHNGFLWGNNFLSALLFFVPRPIWPDKADPTGALVTEQLGWAYTNVSSPLPTELYVGFGIPAVILGGLLLGQFLKRLEVNAMTTSGGSDQFAACHGALLSGFMFILLRGSLQTVLAQIGMAFIFMYVISKLDKIERTSISRDFK